MKGETPGSDGAAAGEVYESPDSPVDYTQVRKFVENALAGEPVGGPKTSR